MSSDINKEVIRLEKTPQGFFEKLQQPETKSIIILLGFSLLLRLLFSMLFNTGHPTDINNFRVWTLEVAKRGVHDFFLPPPQGVWCDYPPGYIYILYFFGSIYKIFDPTLQSWSSTAFTTIVKLPGILADIANVYLIYKLAKRYVPNFIAISAATIYAFQPAMFYESAIWGQMDSVIVLFLLLSVIYLIDHKYALSVFVTAIGCLMKPQGILLIPFIGFVLLYNKAFKQIAIGVAASFALVFALTLPITGDFMRVLPWLWEHYVAQANLYPYSSIQTFNLWGLTGLWQQDGRFIMGLTHKTWGLILFAGFYAYCLYYYVVKSKTQISPDLNKFIHDSETKLKEYRAEKQLEINEINNEISLINSTELSEEESRDKILTLEKSKLSMEKELEDAEIRFNNIKKDQEIPSNYNNEALAIIHASTLILLGFFLFPTRMHERYLFPGLSFLAISTALNYRLKSLYYWLSATFLLNLFYEFPGDKTNIGAPQFMTNLTNFLKSGKMINSNFGFYWYTPIVLINIYIIFSIIYKLYKDSMVNVSNDDLMEYQENKLKEKENDSKIYKSKFFVPPIQVIDKKDWLIILGISVVSLLGRLFYLKYPEEMVFDEVYHARAAGEYMRGINPFEWVHPPLAKLLISVGTSIFGLNSFGWRIMPVIFGTLFVPVMYIFGKTLFSKRWLGVLAAVIISLDGVYFVQSRTAMTNIFATFFQVAAILFFWLYFQHDNHQENKKKAYSYFALSGLFISIALATRWTSLGALGFILGSLIWYKFLFNITLSDIFSGNFSSVFKSFSKKEIPFWLILLSCFAILPAIIYLLAYIPYMNLNHNIHDVIEMQKGIYSYHKNLRDPHPYYSEWYTWPFLIRPTWYYFRDFKDGSMAGIIALGNPAIWWSSLFVTAFVLYKAIKEKQAHLLYIGLGFIILYLPWAVSPRIKNFSHYLFEAIPYACLSITYVIGYLWDKGNPKLERTQEDKNFNILSLAAVGILSFTLLFIGVLALWTLQLKHPFPIDFLQPYSQRMFNSASYLFISLIGIVLYALYENSKFRTLSVVYSSIIVGMFIFFYPLYAGYPMYWWYYSLHIWLSSWI